MFVQESRQAFDAASIWGCQHRTGRRAARALPYFFQHLVRVVEVAQHRVDISLVGRPMRHDAAHFALYSLHRDGGARLGDVERGCREEMCEGWNRRGTSSDRVSQAALTVIGNAGESL
jgi:hypothetical protein